MKATNYLMSFAISTSIAACSHGQKLDTNNIVTKPAVISVWAEWIKDKKSKYDMDFHIRNDSAKYIIVKLDDMTCKRGAYIGRMKYTFFNTGERTIDLAPGQQKGAHMVCNFGTRADGDFEVDISRVYSNPSSDRATSGPVVATDIVWKVAETK